MFSYKPDHCVTQHSSKYAPSVPPLLSTPFKSLFHLPMALHGHGISTGKIPKGTWMKLAFEVTCLNIYSAYSAFLVAFLIGSTVTFSFVFWFNKVLHSPTESEPSWTLQDATFEKMGVLTVENNGRLLALR